MAGRKPKVYTLEYLHSKCEEVGDCWLWNGSTDGKGRPSLQIGGRLNGRKIAVRRLARQLRDRREVPPELQVTSRCGELRCINPECSVIAKPTQTARMAVERGSYARPDRDRRMAIAKRSTSGISDETVRHIRAAESARKAASETGVSLSYCKAIRSGLARKDYGSNPFAGLVARRSPRASASTTSCGSI